MTSEYQYLLPNPDEETKEWWEAAKRHELVAQQCIDCQTFRHPPQLTCTNCYGENCEWVKLSGQGTLYTYIIVHQPVLAAFVDAAPYNVAKITPEEAPNIHFTGVVVDVKNDGLKVGMPLEVAFSDVTPEITIPYWQPR